MADKVSAVELVEAEDRWVVPVGGTVAQCRVDYAFTLVVDGSQGSFEVRIEQPFELLGGVDDGPMSLSWEGDPTALGPALAVLHAELDEALAFKDGRLELRLGYGGRLRVPASDEFEAWTFAGPDGLRLVSMPGGELGVWSPDDSAAASG
jgi:hypothetical protein